MTDGPIDDHEPNDDDEQQAFAHFAVPLPDTLRHQIEAAQAEQDRQNLLNTAFRHDVHRMAKEMAEPHLITLKGMLNIISQSTQSIQAAFLEGVLVTQLEARFGYCAACGVKHDEQFDALLSETRDQMEREGESRPVAPQAGPQPGGDMDDLTLAAQYGLELTENGWRCVNCETSYVSPQDRAIKPAGPEGCSGCQQKAAWG